MSVAKLHLRGFQIDHLLPYLDQRTLASLMAVKRCWGFALIQYCRGQSCILTRKFIPCPSFTSNLQILLAEGRLSISYTPKKNPITERKPLTYADYQKLQEEFTARALPLIIPEICHLTIVHLEPDRTTLQEMVHAFPHLKTIQLRGASKLTELTPLADLPCLEGLDCKKVVSSEAQPKEYLIRGKEPCLHFRMHLACTSLVKQSLARGSADSILDPSKSQTYMACQKLCKICSLPKLAEQIWKKTKNPSPLFLISHTLLALRDPLHGNPAIWRGGARAPLAIACDTIFKDFQITPPRNLPEMSTMEKVFALCKAGLARHNSLITPLTCSQYNCLVKIQEDFQIPPTPFLEIEHGHFPVYYDDKLLNLIIPAFPNLKTLHIAVGPSLTSLRPLLKLQSLQHLALLECPSPWRPLEELEQLTTLKIAASTRQVVVTFERAIKE